MQCLELPDDMTTEASDATPRSVATDEQCEIPQTMKRPCWADLEDSDSDEDRYATPRSEATDEQCEIPQTLKRKCQADLEDSDFEEDTCKDDKNAANRSTNWADLEDSDSDEDTREDDESARSKCAKWADLEDSDDDQEVALKEASQKQMSQPQAWQGTEKKSMQASNANGNLVERRINRSDGKPYTKDEFLSWFGKKAGLERWNASQQASPSLGNTEENRRSYSKKSGRQCGKHECQILVGIEEDKKFSVVRRILGPKGENMKHILAHANRAKVRIRGRGSKYKEGADNIESSDPLMICVSAITRPSYERATFLVEELLQTVQDEYREHCESQGWKTPTLVVRREFTRT
jgi:hypothetical protein